MGSTVLPLPCVRPTIHGYPSVRALNDSSMTRHSRPSLPLSPGHSCRRLCRPRSACCPARATSTARKTKHTTTGSTKRNTTRSGSGTRTGRRKGGRSNLIHLCEDQQTNIAVWYISYTWYLVLCEYHTGEKLLVS